MSEVKKDSNSGSGTHMKKAVITGVCLVAELGFGGIWMENTKMEKQRTGLPYIDLMKKSLGQGRQGFHAGLVPWGVIIGFGKGFVIGGSMSTIKSVASYAGWEGKSADTFSGIGAGCIQGAALTPLMLARNVINENITAAKAGGANVAVSNSLSNVLKEVRVRGPMSGASSLIARQGMNWGCRMAAVAFFGSSDDTPVTKIVKSFVAGLFTATVTMPVDACIPLMQSEEARKFGSTIGYVRHTVKTVGVKTLGRGYVMRCVYVGWHTVFGVAMADIIYTGYFK